MKNFPSNQLELNYGRLVLRTDATTVLYMGELDDDVWLNLDTGEISFANKPLSSLYLGQVKEFVGNDFDQKYQNLALDLSDKGFRFEGDPIDSPYSKQVELIKAELNKIFVGKKPSLFIYADEDLKEMVLTNEKPASTHYYITNLTSMGMFSNNQGTDVGFSLILEYFFNLTSNLKRIAEKVLEQIDNLDPYSAAMTTVCVSRDWSDVYFAVNKYDFRYPRILGSVSGLYLCSLEQAKNLGREQLKKNRTILLANLLNYRLSQFMGKR